jgi:hypothetical protein
VWLVLARLKAPPHHHPNRTSGPSPYPVQKVQEGLCL